MDRFISDVSSTSRFSFVLKRKFVFKMQLQRKKRKKICTFSEQTTESGPGHASVLEVVLSVIYVVTMTPVSVNHVYFVHRLKEIRKQFPRDPREAWEEFNILSYFNVTFNFVLYVFSGSRSAGNASLELPQKSIRHTRSGCRKCLTVDGRC